MHKPPRLDMFRSIAGFAVCSLLMTASAIAAPDFNGDGRNDVLWRQPNGQPMLWLMNGLGAPTRQPTGTAPGNNWLMLGTGNFDGANNNEILFLSSASVLVIWYLQSGQFNYSCATANGPPSGSAFLGLGDVDGNGKTDMLLLGADQKVSAKLLNGCIGQNLAIAPAPAAATAVAVADFDGDGHADILWRNTAGQYIVWLLNGSGLRSAATLSPPVPLGWQLAKATDFNDDGIADLLWRLPDGSLTLSTMNGATHTDVAVTSTTTDAIFKSGFEVTEVNVPPSSLPANWQVVDVGDYDGNGHPDILFANTQGDAEIWLMSGPSVLSAAFVTATPDMPYPGITGWTLPLDRPSLTMSSGEVTLAWNAIPGISSYVVYASAQNNPVSTGVAIAVNGTALTFGRNDPGFADKRYFGITANLFGRSTPPSPEAYLVEFNQIDLGYVGPMSIADINHDGCIDFIGALSNCRGGFSIFSETSMGLGALRANGRAWRDLRFADFNGDGIDDVIANVYSSDNDIKSRILLFRGVGNSQFIEDTDFTALGLSGYGETIVVADFDNDGYLDIFLPKYTFPDPTDHNYLLINDGQGRFTDTSDAAGVAMRNTPINTRPEGAEGVDFDGDGRIDLYVGSHLFMNRTAAGGQPVFVDEAIDRGLPLQFDEGAKFIDWNNDGNLDLVLLAPAAGPLLYESNGNSFHFVNVMPGNITWNSVAGLNAADLDGDGRTDLLVAGGCAAGYTGECNYVGAPHKTPWLLLNRGGGFVKSDYYDDGVSDDYQRSLGDLQTVADFDASGTLDVAVRYPQVSPISGFTGNGNTKILINRASSARSIHVTVLGPAGQQNQFGRVVRVSVLAKPGFVMTDVVDGGSGYLANTPYPLQFSAPYAGAYRIEVDLADRQVDVLAAAGQNITIYADGRVMGTPSPATVTMRTRSR